MALGDGGPPAVLGLDAPDQGASQGPSGRWAILVGDQFQQLSYYGAGRQHVTKLIRVKGEPPLTKFVVL
jgi:hypothetical protein